MLVPERLVSGVSERICLSVCHSTYIVCFVYCLNNSNNFSNVNTLRTGAFKLFKCTFLGSKQFKSTFILCFFKYL